jgi:chemosensory pili system protein ChpA (sensor histidine kinase/response regulator)
MTALHDAIEYSALGWIKPELDETLRLVRVEIEGFADEPADTSRMRVCADLLHQVQGTLRMVELYAPAMVAEEMEQLAGALRDGKVQDRDGACSALMRGVVLLPDYLERLQSGHKEISIVLLPMLNELRGARGETGLSESVLFNPDLDRPLPATLPRATPLSPAARAHEVAPYLVRFRDALDAWPENGLPGDTEGLHFAVEALLARTTDESQRRMLWVASLVADALRDRALPADAGLRQVFASVDRESRSLFQQGGFGTPRADAAMEPTRQLLFHVAHAESDHPSLLKLRQVFELDALKPTESELDHARGSVAGRNRSLLDTVSAAIKEDLLRVKDELDLYLRTGKQDPAELRPQAERLQSVSDTLGMLGLGLARSLVQQQRDAMQDIVDGKRKADETALLEVAGALLYVDASLDDQVARLASGDGTDTEEDLANAEARKVLDVLVREAIGNFAAARQAFVAFVETAWNHAELEPVPPLLREVSGALKMLELPLPASYLDGVRLYTEYELLGRRRIPNSRQLDTFADALASVEYYLEALREQRANRDDILDITRNSLEALGYWPLPPERAVPTPAEVAPREVPAVAEVPTPAIEAASIEPSPVQAPAVEAPVAAEPTPAELAPVELAPVEAVADEPAAIEPAVVEPVAIEPVAIEPEVVEPEVIEAVTLEAFEPASLDATPADPTPVAVAEVAPPAAPEPPAPAPAPAPFVTLFVPPREPVAPPAPAPEVVAVPAAAPAAATTGFDTANDDIDDEIREIFLEEFEEEIGNLAQLLPAWKADPNNIELLQPVRRVFHTLKGSGRLVGARTLGEFSWKIENMLNKVRDGLRPATPPVVAMVDQAYAALPQLHAALRGDGVVTADLRALEAYADRIAGGEEVMPVLAAAAPVAAPVEAIEVAAPVEPAPAPVEAAAVELPVVEAPAIVESGEEVSVDPVLFEILQAEVSGHLVTIDDWLARAHAAPTAADDPLLRAIHTMNGAFAMTEVPSITDALTPAEGYVRRLLATGGDVDAEGVSAIAELADRVRDTVVAIAEPGGRVPACDALAARLVALRDSLPEAGPVHVVDHPPAVPEAPVELTDLDLSAYGRFDLEPAAEAPVASAAAPAPGLLDPDQLAREAEAELARLFAQAEAPVAPQAPAVSEPATGAPTSPEDPARLLALMESYEAERAEAERAEAERAEAERAEAERAEAERAEAERAEAERAEAERAEAERAEAERAEAERLAALRRAEHEDFMRFEAERLEAERLEAERLEAERLEAERLEAERLEAERLEAERLEAERLEAERLEAERLEAERLEAERLEAERLEAERLEAELREQELRDLIRIEDERLEAERLEAERREAELLEAERLLAEGSEPEPEAHVELPAFADFVIPEEPAPVATAPVEAAPAEPAPAADAARAADSVISVLLAHSAVTDPDEALDMRDLDADLIDIFVEEGRDLLDHSDQLLVGLREAPEDREIIAGLQRDLHTLKGGARMAGVMPIGELGHAMESLLEAAAEHRLRLGRDDIPLLETGFDRLHTMVTRVGDRRAVAVPDALVAAFDTRALGHALELPAHLASAPEPAAEAPAFADFDAHAEAAEHAFVEPAFVEPAVAEPAVAHEVADDHADDAIEIEEIALDAVALDTAFAEPVPVEEVAFAPEPVAFEPVPVETALVEAEDVEAAFGEAMHVEATHADATHVDVGHDEAATPEAAVAEAGSADAEPEDTLEAQPVAAEAPTFAPLPGLRPLSAPMTFGDRDDEDASLRGNQEQVRVRAELLDRLVNYAGEVAIYRSRLEQQLGAFRGATSEMEQTTARLRDQLRRLEIETEAQIIARYQREGEKPDAAFDPLELDRFSTLQQLSRALSETATDLGSLHTTLDDLTQQYETLLLQQSRVSSELQEGLMRTRMVPFDTVVPRLRRVLRQAAADTGRQVQLKVDGAQGELDRNVLERMTAPLEHMLRNSVAHGLESPAQRAAAGKPAEGVVVIAVRKEGSEVVLQITDDGRGLDRKAIRERGEARGLVRPGMALSNAQLDALIFEPGFSTAEEVTRLAGRGVGMDVVSSEVRQLGGTIDIRSEPGKGTDFILRLPQTLAVTQAAFVRIGETTFAVPIASVRGVGRIPRDELANGATTYRYGNEEYALHDLGKLVGETPAKAEGQLQMPLLLTRSGDLHVAVTVDQIVGNREIVVKPIGPQVASIPGIFGATIMGDGSVVVILDVAPLVRRLAVQPEEIEEAPAVEQRAVPLVMVVDDSITMRKVTGRVLERHNFEVLTAKDGLDALERMVDVVPDLMLLDIEMPRMDGYELATAMKADARLAKVPIIMITSRTGDKHRQRAMDIGVDRYLGKPYQENELMRNVFSLLEPVRSDA